MRLSWMLVLVALSMAARPTAQSTPSKGGGKGMTAGERGPTPHNGPSVNFDPR